MKLHKNSVSGVALIIVLGFLVIITALTVAFFSSVTTELKASRNFAAGITTRQLADSSVQIVMGQISAATTRGIDTSTGNPTSGQGNEAWASQPGMLRVYGQNSSGGSTASSAADAFYKLYSSNKMILTTGDGTLNGFNATNDYLQAWNTAPALWTDLNAPVLVRDVNGSPVPRFPIIDPRAYVTAVDLKTPFDKDKWDTDVEGFTYDQNAVNGAVGPGKGNDQRLPMPVRWIYVLQDGTLTTPDDGGTTAARFDTAPAEKQPRIDNPIVGRIAFWTDDETCKLNLNTAAGFTQNLTSLNPAYQADPTKYAGSYWDTPRFYTEFDYGIPDATGVPKPNMASGGLALCQLLQNEFQRYPGHPATTSLTPVLNTLILSGTNSKMLTSEQLYSVVPRYSDLNLQGQHMSTIGGTQRVIVDPIASAGDLDNKQLQPKQDRLYASVDEFLYGPHVKTGNFTTPTYKRVTNNDYYPLPGNPITPDVVDRLRFFLTAQSRAPELNLFGQPRISCWPVRSELSTGENTGLNVFDNLILFCSTVGTAPTATTGRPDTKSTAPSGVYRYIFTRREVVPTTDTQAVSRTDSMGISQSQYEFKTSYIPDCESTRNKALLGTYLLGTTPTKGLLNRAIPGVGMTYADKQYGTADMQSIMTEIFDYIRMANSQDTTTTISTGTAIPFAPRGLVLPSKPTYFASPQAKGFGRMSTICEATLDFYYAGPVMETAYTPPTGYLPNVAATNWSHWDPNISNARYAKTQVDTTGKNPKVSKGYMRAFLLFSTFDPMQGYAPKSDPVLADPKMSIEVRWPQPWNIVMGNSNVPLNFPVTTSTLGVTTTVYRSPASYWGGRNYGGYEGFMHTLMGGGVGAYKCKWSPTVFMTSSDIGETYNLSNANQPLRNKFVPDAYAGTSPTSALQEYYPFQTIATAPIVIPGPGDMSYTVPPPSPTFGFLGGDLTVLLYYGGNAANNVSGAAGAKSLQTINMYFPPVGNLPFPQGPPAALNEMKATPVAVNAPTADVTTWASMSANPIYFGSNPGTNTQGDGIRTYYWTGNGAFFANSALSGIAPTFARSKPANTGVHSYQTSLQASWSLATRIAWCTVPDTATNRLAGGASYNPYTNSSGSPVAPGYQLDRWRCVVQPGDTIRSLLYWDGLKAGTASALSGTGATSGGDIRLGAINATVAKENFAPHPDYIMSGLTIGPSRACVLRGGDGNPYFPVGNIAAVGNDTVGSTAAVLIAGTDPTKEATLGNHILLGTGVAKFPVSRAFANLPASGGNTPKAIVNGVNRSDNNGKYPGDFDTGVGDFPDGPFVNKQDEGNVVYRYLDYNGQYVYPIPYFTNTWSYQKPGNTFTSPSRQMPSPGMFGSLPSQVPENKNWQTLSFSPIPAGDKHPGNVDPKDHYLLDLFMMPVVEPYPISEPFSTAGKVNLNYRIAPFDYIRRSTALRGALYPLRVTVVDSQGAQGGSQANYLTYKTGINTAGVITPITTNFRRVLDRDLTIQAIDGFYDAGIGQPDTGFFKSATQICERYLYPTDITSYAGDPASEATAMRTWWNTHGDLTGDNEREKPYVDLYPRVTTKSNTYTVHMRVQTLRQIPKPATGDWRVWNEGKDNVLGEYRGATTIERYIDPADPRFSGGNSRPINPDNQSVEPLYHFRTVINKKFTP